MEKTFSERLTFCLDKGKLTFSDLALWMGRCAPTIRTWVQGRTPMPYYREEAERRLSSLEKVLENKSPIIPLTVSLQERSSILKEIMNVYLHDSFSDKDTTE